MCGLALFDIGTQDREKLNPFQQRIMRVLRFLQHSLLEGEKAQLAIHVEFRIKWRMSRVPAGFSGCGFLARRGARLLVPLVEVGWVDISVLKGILRPALRSRHGGVT
jgi:hypothetical protein